MIEQKGSVSINAENMMPIIKKWLYSDRDIFVREVIANGCDAMTKYNKLSALGEAPVCDDFRVNVTADLENASITFEDNGIGMTVEEVENYINQVAFSGAKDFVSKYEAAGSDAIIGHFGLGFYSVFMVAKKVTIDTLSFKEGAEAVHWESESGDEYAISASERTERGTTVTLYLDDENTEFADSDELRQVIQKYCAFLPYPIYLADAHGHDGKCACGHDHEHGDECTCGHDHGHEHDEANADETEENASETTVETEEEKAPMPLNDVSPLWLKNPTECTDDEYKAFYRKVFHVYEEPLFWIHLNVDYPFNLKGILYFPKLNNRFETVEGQIKLYNNQVFVADNIKEVIPEFLMLLKGVIDCPDLPLNVSRSFLQNDGTVKRMQTHITKKVADKLKNLFENDRETYEKDWDDINPFIKYGAIKDEKFYDQIKDALIFRKLDKTCITLAELQEMAKNEGGKAYYVSDENAQAHYIDMFKAQNQTAVILSGVLDSHFISYLEYKCEGLKFARIDSEIAQSRKGQYEDMPDAEKLKPLFVKVTGDEDMQLEVAPIKADIPAMFVVDETMRRMNEMQRSFMGGLDLPAEEKLVLNGCNETVKKLAGAEGENADLIAAFVYDIAVMGRGNLTAEETRQVLEHSTKLLSKLSVD